MKRRRRSLGYTLQELMIVIAIIGIAAAVAAGRLNGKGRQSRDAQRLAERITTALERARINAVSTRSEHRVVLAPATGDYHIDQLVAGTWTQVERVALVQEAKVWDTKATMGAPGAQSGTQHIIRFRPDFTVDLDGGPAINAHVYVSGVRDSYEGHAFRIHVNGAGTVRMYENW